VTVNGQHHAPGAPVTLEYGSEWAPESVWTFWRKENFLVAAGFRTPDHVACSPVSIPAALSHFHWLFWVHKMWGISWLVDPLLGFQGQFCSKELVFWLPSSTVSSSGSIYLFWDVIKVFSYRLYCERWVRDLSDPFPSLWIAVNTASLSLRCWS